MKKFIPWIAGIVVPVSLIAQPAVSTKPAKTLSLEQRIQAIEDRDAILKVMCQYAYTVDFGKEVGEYTALYTEDAVFQSIAPGADPTNRAGAVVGRPGLEQWIVNEWKGRDRLLAAGHYRIHTMIEPDITLDGDRASARSYFQTTDNDNGRIYMVSIGVYQDEFVRSQDGRWRMKQRLLLRQGAGANNAGANARPASAPAR